MSWRVRATCCLALLFGVSSKGRGANRSGCNRRFEAPDPGSTALALNGVRLPDTCIDSDEDQHHVFIIGDWGGLPGDPETGNRSVTADHRKTGKHARAFVAGLDDWAQHVVRDRIRERAAVVRPEYFLNVGDNFYWGGVEATCGTTRQNMDFSPQWEDIFESFYTGDGLDGVQWLGVLGNHDYGGYLYSNAWDQAIMYTWKKLEHGRTPRWVTPAQYWRSTVHYNTFSVEYFFLDTNWYDVWEPYVHMANNICSYAYNPGDNGADCSGEGGPPGIDSCQDWFRELWDEQLEWLRLHLSNSTADWQIIVTHFPPSYDPKLFRKLSHDYGIDLFVSGHLHSMAVHGSGIGDDIMNGTGWLVSGGGGGITSDHLPNHDGDNAYGFMHMTLSSDSIEAVIVQHTGAEGKSVKVSQRPCVLCSQDDVAHNLQVYQEGLQRRGLAGSPRSPSSTATTTTTASSAQEEAPRSPEGHDLLRGAALESPMGWKEVVDDAGGWRELRRASGPLENVMISPSGAAGVGVAAALVAALALWLRVGSSSSSRACRPGVPRHDHDASRELLQVDAAPRLLDEGQTPPAEEAPVEDDAVWQISCPPTPRSSRPSASTCSWSGNRPFQGVPSV